VSPVKYELGFYIPEDDILVVNSVPLIESSVESNNAHSSRLFVTCLYTCYAMKLG
jgi:hypothetical protein